MGKTEVKRSFLEVLSKIKNLFQKGICHDPRPIASMTYSDMKAADSIVSMFQRLIDNLWSEDVFVEESAAGRRVVQYALLSQAIMESISSGILIIEKDRRIGLVNTAGREILGLKGDSLAGRPLREVFDEYSELDRLVRATLKSGNGERRKEILVRTKDGKKLHLGASLSPLVPGRGGCEAVIVVFTLLGIDRARNLPAEAGGSFGKDRNKP